MKDSRMKIEYNNPQSSQRRSENIPPTLEENNRVVGILNARLNLDSFEDADLIQKFIFHYENLDHHMSITCGLWATDQPDKVQDPENLLFQITF